MALIAFGDVPFDAGLVVLDKDGTLIDFDLMWSRLTGAWIERLVAESQDNSLAQDLYQWLGFDPGASGRQTDPLGPAAMSTTGQMHTIAAALLYRRGVPWPHAIDRAQATYRQAVAGLPLPELVRPAGDVVGLVRGLRSAGVRVVVVTTDHRAETEETLRLLGIAGLVDGVVCGDDGMPPKPAPDTLLAACRLVGVPPSRTSAVGDTVADLLMAQRAGAGLRVGVLTGAGSRESLAPLADVLLASIDGIKTGM